MKVIFVVGPTASGKSKLAFEMASKNKGAIINCDSIQVYQKLDIGSSKPSPEERAALPHYLFDYIPAGESLTAGSYARDFFELLEKIKSNFEYIYVVGGTGFYFQAIEKGMYAIGSADPQTLLQVENEIQKDVEKVYQELKQKDPRTAEKISIQDHYRLARAVEMMRTHGKSVSQIKEEFEASKTGFPYPLEKIGIWAEREELIPLVKLRTQKMLQQGLLEEVEGLLKQGLETWQPLSSVGYREACDYLLQRGSAQNVSELAEKICTSTLQLAKKQRTWFKRDKDIRWLQLDKASSWTIA